MANLLSVDWDYFFPRPDRMRPLGDDWQFYDWTAGETPLLISSVWESRALGFLLAGMELPMAQGYEGFWNRFRFRRGAKLYYAESHSVIVSKRLFNRFTEGRLWNFDAHHDAGYHSETIAEILARLKIGRATCEDWVFWYYAAGTVVDTIYPVWQADGIEPEPAICIGRQQDDLEPVDEWFSAVFLCRSGAWMPSWTDGQFREFLGSFPGPVEELSPLVNREFDLGAAEKMVEVCRRLGSVRLG